MPTAFVKSEVSPEHRALRFQSMTLSLHPDSTHAFIHLHLLLYSGFVLYIIFPLVRKEGEEKEQIGP